jgi:archaellum component FlaC
MVTSWSDAFRANPSIEVIQLLGQRLSDAMDRAASPGAIDQLKRAQAVVDHFTNGIRRPEVVPLKSLTNANPVLSQALGEVEAFMSDGNENHLNTVNEHLDVALAQVPIPVPPRRESLVILEESRRFAEEVTRLHQTLVNQVSNLTSDIGNQKQIISQAASSFERKLQELSESARVAQQNIQTDAARRIEELRTEITNQKTRLDTAIEQQATQFISDQTDRSKAFSEILTKLSSDLQQKIDSLITEARAQIEGVQQEGAQAVRTLQDFEDQARNIVAVTAASGVAGSYVAVAREQPRQANLWRWIALILLVLVFVSVSASTLIHSPLGAGNLSAQDFAEYGLTRIPIVLALTGLWGYAARESSRHRRREAEAERLATELTSFRPFLAELPRDQQQEIVKEASRRYFKGWELPPNTDGEDA